MKANMVSIDNPLLPYDSKSGMLLISNVLHSKWPIHFMIVYTLDGKLSTVRMIFRDGTGVVMDINNI